LALSFELYALSFELEI